MKDKGLKTLEKVLEEIGNMTAEEYKTELLCLNGKMTEELLNEVMTEITTFMDVFYYIEEFAKYNKVNVHDYFPEYKIFFVYNAIHYVWRLVQGQDSHCEIYCDTENEYEYFKDKVIELSIDETIEFYKRIH